MSSGDTGSGEGDSRHPSVGGGGRYVAFESYAANLDPRISDTNSSTDIFVHDRISRTTTLLSASFNGTVGNGNSHNPSISADGNRVAFWSFASNLVPDDQNGFSDIFLSSRYGNYVMLISRAPDGTAGNGSSGYPSISADGRWIAFESQASNLVLTDTNNTWDIFVHDLWTGKTELVSLNSQGGAANGESRLPSISADGNRIAFYSLASDLVAGKNNNAQWQVYVYDRRNRSTRMVSLSSGGVPGNGASGGRPEMATGNRAYLAPRISGNGRWVAFPSLASNLVSSDTNGVEDLFLHDLNNESTTRISVSGTGAQARGASYQPSISMDGRWILFTSEASNLVANDSNNVSDVFLHDRLTGRVWLVSLRKDGTQEIYPSAHPAIAPSGGWLAFDSSGHMGIDASSPYRNVFALRMAGKVSGKFLLPGAAEGQVGWVFAMRDDSPGIEAPIQQDGTFALSLPPGKWHLNYYLKQSDWYGPPLNGGAPIEIGPQHSLLLPAVQLRSLAGQPTLYAMIKDGKGQPLVNAELMVGSRMSDGSTHFQRVTYDSAIGKWPFRVNCEAGGEHMITAMLPTRTPNVMPPAPQFFTSCPSSGEPFILQFRAAPIRIRGTLHHDGATQQAAGEFPAGAGFVWGRNPRGGHVHVPVNPDGTFELYVSAGTWEFGAGYEDEAGNRYRAPINQRQFLEEQLEVSFDIFLDPTPLPPLPAGIERVVFGDEDTTIALPDGAELYIPAGTLGSADREMTGRIPVTFTIQPVDVELPRTEELTPLDYGYEILVVDENGQELHGPFPQKLRLTLPLDPEVHPEDVGLFYFSSEYNEYVQVEEYVIDHENNRIHGYIDHFSRWARGRPSSVGDEISSLTVEHGAPAIVGQTVPFTATASPSESVVFSWEFGDGTVGAGANPTHIYALPGHYTATVTATNTVSELVEVATVSVEARILLPLIRR